MHWQEETSQKATGSMSVQAIKFFSLNGNLYDDLVICISFNYELCNALIVSCSKAAIKSFLDWKKQEAEPTT